MHKNIVCATHESRSNNASMCILPKATYQFAKCICIKIIFAKICVLNFVLLSVTLRVVYCASCNCLSLE